MHLSDRRIGLRQKHSCKLIAGLYPPEAGTMHYGSYGLRDIALDCLRQQVDLIPQAAQFFNRSIIENFKFAYPAVRFEQVVAACDLALADEFIRELPDEWQTVLGEFGANLSGGQRLAIARALVAHQPVLELRLMDRLQQHRAGLTTSTQLKEKVESYNVARANLAKDREAVAEQRSRSLNEQVQLKKERAANRAEDGQVDRDLRSTQVKAPVNGVVSSLNLLNLQQLVGLGEEQARIAPSDAGLVGKVLVASQDITYEEVGQRAVLRMASCPYPDFGTLRSGGGHEVTPRPQSTVLRSRTRACQLRQGMDLSADITTRIETVLQLLLRKARLQGGMGATDSMAGARAVAMGPTVRSTP